MPSLQTIELYRLNFGYVDVRYFGSIVWFLPIAVRLMGEKKAAQFSDMIDKIFHIKKSAFKFVMIVKKENE